jgi:hypothetical protein
VHETNGPQLPSVPKPNPVDFVDLAATSDNEREPHDIREDCKPSESIQCDSVDVEYEEYFVPTKVRGPRPKEASLRLTLLQLDTPICTSTAGKDVAMIDLTQEHSPEESKHRPLNNEVSVARNSRRSHPNMSTPPLRSIMAHRSPQTSPLPLPLQSPVNYRHSVTFAQERESISPITIPDEIVTRNVRFIPKSAKSGPRNGEFRV